MADTVPTMATTIDVFLAREPKAQLIEGESAVTTNFLVDVHDPLHTVRRGSNVLARSFAAAHGGKVALLLTKKKCPSGYRAAYQFEVGARGAYDWWIFEQGREWASPFSWRIDSGAWQKVGADVIMNTWTRLAADGPTFAWAFMGSCELEAGPHVLEVRVTAPRKNGVYVFSPDCFLLTPVGSRTDGPPFSPDQRAITAKTIWLYPAGGGGSRFRDDFTMRMEPFLLPGSEPRPAVIVFPGGSYRAHAPIEAEPVARVFNAMGFHSFVLYYRVYPHQFPKPLLDAATAVRIVRSRAGEFGVRPDRIAVCGFSAGGHLAASIGALYSHTAARSGDKLDPVSARPDALILGYPWFPDDRSTPPLMKAHTFVTPRTPPAFFMLAGDDDLGIENSLRFARALKEKKVPYEMHLYQKGGHGFGTGQVQTHTASWVGLCEAWLKGCVWEEGQNRK